jgi:transposase
MKEISFFLGCDVSKGYCDFLMLDQKTDAMEKNFQLDDTPAGHQGLCSFLERFVRKERTKRSEAEAQRGQKAKKKKKGQKPRIVIHVGLESTGGYENNWYHLFNKVQEAFNLKVARINPAVIKKHKEASMVRTETDKVSARHIAEYMIRYADKIQYNQQGYYASLRRLWKFIRLLKKQRSQLLSHLESLLYTAHPQFLKYCQKEWYEWHFRVLEKYPTARRLAGAEEEELVSIPYVTAPRAQELIRDAKVSVASAVEPVMESLIQSAVHHLISLTQTIKLQEQQLKQDAAIPEVELLKSFKGIDTYSAVGLMIEIGAVTRFPTVKNLGSHWGVPPVYKESGDGTRVPRMSKKGRSEPRYILFNVALSAINSNDMIKQLYEDYQANGFCKMAALGIIMHKISRIIYGMLKNNTPYNPQIDQANRLRSKKSSEQKKVKKDQNRRFQNYDEDAPISNRQRKKRLAKTKLQSQGGEAQTVAYDDINNSGNSNGLTITSIRKIE